MADSELKVKVDALFHNKWTWIGLGAGALGVVYYFHKSAANAVDTTVPTTDTTGTTDSTDSSYGDYADGGYSPIDSSSLGAYGTTPTAYQYDPSTGQYDYVGTTVTGVSTPSNNQQWAQQAELQLSTAGYSPQTAAVAIGKYLLGYELTSDQLGVVQAAIGLIGPTPSPVPAPHVAPVTAPSTPTVKPLGTPKITKISSTKGKVVIGWLPVPNATSYDIHLNGSPIAITKSLKYTATKSGNYNIYAITASAKYTTSKSSNSLAVKVVK